MTLKEHRDDIFKRIPKEAQYDPTSGITDLWLTEIINEAYRELHQECVWQKRKTTDEIAEGSYYINLPSDFWGIVKVAYKDSTQTNYDTLYPMQVLASYYPNATGAATHYAIMPNNTITLNFVSANPFNLRYVYWSNHTELTADTDESYLPEEITHFIRYYVVDHAFQVLGMLDRADVFHRRYKEELVAMLRRRGKRHAEVSPIQRKETDQMGYENRFRLWPGGPWSE